MMTAGVYCRQCNMIPGSTVVEQTAVTILWSCVPVSVVPGSFVVFAVSVREQWRRPPCSVAIMRGKDTR